MDTRKKRIIIGVVAAVVVCILIGGTAIYLHAQQKNDKEQDTVVAETTPVPTATPVPTPTVDPHLGQVRSSITGEWVEKKTEAKRPYAVMINNIEYAFDHQKGTSKADILYEALAEGGITRMLAVYQDPSNVKVIGSVRSARHYYVQFAKEWNAIYCHFGQTKYATAKIEEIKVNNLSGLSAIGPVVYKRDTSIKAPHNVYTSGKKLQKGAKRLKYSLKQNKKKAAKHFAFYEEDTDPDVKRQAKSVVLPFSNYSTCRLKYNAEKKKYYKYEYGKKHMDTFYKKQLAFKNVIIQFVEESNIDHNGYQTMELTNNSGKGYYMTNGKIQKITWKRKEAGNKMVYRDRTGKLLTINPGKTYIAVYPKSRRSLITIK
ncbi:MAG: DUF3048 domain-containing protein [Butyribacter sp.]|nr:DUF3048 domain-containing protein [bacterium]MDY3855107.1 DUF3048 domain-containing protein [Butyribacter sp.]